MRVWKKALRCLSVAEWRWEYVIIEMECEESALIGYPVGKCRVPSVTVVRIHPYKMWDDADPARAACDKVMSIHSMLPTDRMEKIERDYMTGRWFGRRNFTSLSDGDVVSWYDHTKWTEGATVACDRWDPRPDTVCGHGIHCFRTRGEADEYMI